jgi:hypothetical protein
MNKTKQKTERKDVGYTEDVEVKVDDAFFFVKNRYKYNNYICKYFLI